MRLWDWAKVQTQIPWRDRERIFFWYVAIFFAFCLLGLAAYWRFWPYDDVRFSQVGDWPNGAPVVVQNTLADVTFTLEDACNESGKNVLFRRYVVQHPDSFTAPYFMWRIGDAELVNPAGESFCTENDPGNDLPVRVQFPANYTEGTYYIEFHAVYQANPLYEREVAFVSPLFEIVAP